MQFIIDNKETFIAVDLANDEANFDCLTFASVFQKAKAAGLRVTIHSGEIPCDSSPKRVSDAVLQLGAERIGHGLHVMRDVKVAKEMKSKNIHFEICPTSNYLTNAVDTIVRPPLTYFSSTRHSSCALFLLCSFRCPRVWWWLSCIRFGVFGEFLSQPCGPCVQILPLSRKTTQWPACWPLVCVSVSTPTTQACLPFPCPVSFKWHTKHAGSAWNR